MSQPGLDRDFQHMTIQETRKQLSPTIARKPQPQASMGYRPGPAPFRSYHDGPDEFPPPPPPPTVYVDHNFPPPPPEMKENIYHEITDEDFPPPPPTGAPGEYNRAPDAILRPTGYGTASYGSLSGVYEPRQLQTGPYERVVKQATISVQSSDSSGRSSPYGSQYANFSSLQGTYASAPSTTPSSSLQGTYASAPSSTPSAQTYSPSYGQYSSNKPRSESPTAYAPSSPRRTEEPGVTYASINQDANVTYAQVKPRSDRAVPGPQIPVQIKVTDSRPQMSPDLPASRSPGQATYSPGQATYMAPTPLYSTDMKSGPMSKSADTKEQEVDALTQMLMQGLEGTKDPEFFGICAKCGKKVMGESNGCSAMDQVFHIACFICVNCGDLLRGKSFYAMERKPYCEGCYMSTLERCSICSKPITDRLLRATGKPYHPGCFTCVVCGKSLDGVPFTVDATNQIHCIEDFHKKFAPRCCVCHHPIMPERGQEETVRVVAMDRSFHVQCYRCEDCGMLLSSEAEGKGCYPLDDHILCKNCNAKRINALTTKLSTEL